MATISGVRGLLLEEAILFLLKASGYRTIEDTSADPEILHKGPAGMEINGRGGKHQIDAIADFHLSAPFSYPQRLLLEAKCYSDTYKVGIEVVRNAVGVLKDVSELWVTKKTGVPAKPRYHYQYAIFSASGYTKDAERYAYAQDIYLINLHRTRYLEPIINAIRSITHHTFGATAWNRIDIRLSDLREAIRRSINEGSLVEQLREISQGIDVEQFENLTNSCMRLGESYLAMISNRFPVFLAPAPNVNFQLLKTIQFVRVRWDIDGWYIYTEDDQKIFSFDLPLELFSLYETEGLLTKRRAVDLKQEMMSEIQIVIGYPSQVNVHYRDFEVITLYLDQDWIQQVRNRIRE
jgi:hypothetical protein